MNQRGSWEAARPCRLSLEATAGISSSHWCLGKRGQQAGGQRVGGHRREDPSCAYRLSAPLCCLTGPTQPTPHASQISNEG